MKRVTRLLRPAAPRNPSTVMATALAAVLPALALAGAFFAGAAQADVVTATPDKRAFVNFETCAKPVWPQASLAAHHTGTVTLAFMVGKDGSVEDAKVKKSSGHPALDEAALEGIRKCRFVAGVVDGKPVTSWMQMQYAWMLH